jgi:hypothetical protein
LLEGNGSAIEGTEMSKAELVEAVQKSLGKEASAAQAERIVLAVVEGIKIGLRRPKAFN